MCDRSARSAPSQIARFSTNMQSDGGQTALLSAMMGLLDRLAGRPFVRCPIYARLVFCIRKKLVGIPPLSRFIAGMLPTDPSDAPGSTCAVNGRSDPSGNSAWNGSEEPVKGDEEEKCLNESARTEGTHGCKQHHSDHHGTDADTEAANRARKEAVPAAALGAVGGKKSSNDSSSESGDDGPEPGPVMEEKEEYRDVEYHATNDKEDDHNSVDPQSNENAKADRSPPCHAFQ